MAWYVYLAYFVAGLCLANGIPHFVNGISGKKFQSPFASPPGVGESSPVVNVIWGMVNFVISWILILGVGNFSLSFTLDVLMVVLGMMIASVGLALHFGRVRSD
jgi:hypothetical protein